MLTLAEEYLFFLYEIEKIIMLEESKKSIQNILNQRISSPFYGTLIVSWLLWNWKIIYLTIFVSEQKILSNKIDFIIANYNNVYHLIWLPLLSTLLILTLIPFLTNGAFWLDLKFEQWRVEQKNTIEKKQLLSIEQSISLREQILNMETRFETLLSDKNAEINQLKLLITELEKGNKNTEITIEDIVPLTNKNNEIDEIEILATKILGNQKLKNANSVINQYILGSYSNLVSADGVSTEILSFYQSNGLIDKSGSVFKWTDKGKEVNKIISSKAFD